MANSKSALKRVRQSSKKESRNTHHVSTMRSAMKALEKAVNTGEGEVNELYQNAIQAIDRVAGKNLLHKNNANRKKANMARLVNKQA